jgi:hypothetical protein
MPAVGKRIAMWSGPRNISTALMRAWGNRADTFVCDEPLYAHYLLHTRLPHPGADDITRHHETDWRKVADWLTGPVPEGKAIFYQKHMTHHLLPGIGRDWLDHLDHAFLIREPRQVLRSLARVTPNPRLEDTGFPQQCELFRQVRQRTGRVPPVVDAQDVLQNPCRLLRLLCAALEVEFAEAMLSWAPGPRATDGIWAKHWYSAVLKSTGFEPYRTPTEPFPEGLTAILRESEPLYRELQAHRLF